jgi:CheY-like chemotaxis protein/CheY-specific phosphatase CheX
MFARETVFARNRLMGAGREIIHGIMDAISSRTRAVLASEASLNVLDVKISGGEPSELVLHDITAIASMENPIGLRVAFSFERDLLAEIFSKFTSDIDVPQGDSDRYARDVAAEILNIVLGLCTMDDPCKGQRVALSSPVVIDGPRNIRRPNDAVFSCMRISTDHGGMDVSVVGPKDMFDKALNCIDEGAMDSLAIMVVDDSFVTIKKLGAMLENLGHKVVVTASNGRESLDAYRKFSPDLVTMDITMPDMDGIEATRQIVTEFPDARIIMVTSMGQEEMVLDALKAGAVGYVLKPFCQVKIGEAIVQAVVS